jgi:hypothetical protein
VRPDRLLRTGLTVLAAAVLAQVVVSELIWAREVAVPRVVASLMSPLITAAFVTGAALVAGSCVVRELARQGVDDLRGSPDSR